MPAPSCLAEIHSRYPSFSAKEKSIADAILASPRDAVHPSIEELAERIGVSESTLFRFVRKLGYDGYQQFRISLATETIAPSETVYEAPEAAENERSAVAVVFRSTIEALEASLKSLDPALLEGIAEAIVASPRLLILGLGGSSIVAQDAYHKLMRTGIRCEAPIDYHMQLMAASQAAPGDLALLFSHTGSNKDAILLAEELKRAKATLILATSQSRSPLAKFADHLLITRSPATRYASEAFSARIVQLAIVDSLYILVMERLGEKGMRHLGEMRRAIARRRL